jgi:hypothetical protein
MNISMNKFRTNVFIIWISSFILYIFEVVLAKILAGDGINTEQMISGIITFSSIFMPVLIAFTSFWFSPNFTSHNKEKNINDNRPQIGYFITIIPNAIGIIVGLFAIVFQNYNDNVHNVYLIKQIDSIKLLIFATWSISLYPVSFLVNFQIPTNNDYNRVNSRRNKTPNDDN